MVTHVDEISFPCADTFRCRQRFRYALVRRVRLRPQGVYYQNIQSLQLFIRSVRHRKHVRYIPQPPADTVSQDGQPPVHHGNRQYFRFPHVERPARFHFLQINARYTRIFLIHKAIRHPRPQMGGRVGIRIDGYFRKTAERAQIVQSAHMVVMLVGYQHAVYPLVHGSAQHLCPEIGTAVYQYHRIVRMQQGGCTQTAVPRVGRCADGACAANFRHSGRCSAS